MRLGLGVGGAAGGGRREVYAANDFVVGVHLATEAVGLRVFDLRRCQPHGRRPAGEGRAHLYLQKILRRAVNLVEALRPGGLDRCLHRGYDDDGFLWDDSWGRDVSSGGNYGDDGGGGGGGQRDVEGERVGWVIYLSSCTGVSGLSHICSRGRGHVFQLGVER